MPSPASDNLVKVPGVVPQRLCPRVPRAEMLVRTGLIDRLHAVDATVIVLRAGAGFGKTVTLDQWASSEQRPVGWLTMDATDDDPVVLLRHLVSALADAGQDVELAAGALMRPDPDVAGIVYPALALAMERSTVPFLMVLDDVGNVSATGSLELGAQLIDLLPAGCTVVLSGRAIPDLHLARREVAGELVRLDESDLAFTPDEARDFVQREVLDLDDGEVDELVDLTNGWPAGVHLAVRALAEPGQPQREISDRVVSDRRLAWYLEEELLSQLAPSERAFLSDVSVLGHLCGPCCDAATGRDDSAVHLRALTAAGIAVPEMCSGNSDTYRLTPMLRPWLADELRRRDPRREAEVRLAEAHWLDERGDVDAAIRQALAAHDVEAGVDIVFRHLMTNVYRGDIASVQRGLELFPPKVVARNLLLLLTAGWVAFANGDRVELGSLLAEARTCRWERGELPDGTLEPELAVAALAMVSGFGGVEATLEAAEMIVAAGRDASRWWEFARHLLTVAEVSLGKVDPVEGFAEAEVATRSEPTVHAVTLAHLAIAHARRGDRTEADRLTRRAVEEESDHVGGGFSLTGMVHCAASVTAAMVGDRPRSRRHATDAAPMLDVTSRLVPRAGIQARQLLAEAAMIRGDREEADTMLAAARTLLDDEPAAAGLAESQDVLERRVAASAAAPAVDELTDRELRVAIELRTHRSLEEIGRHLYISRNTVKSHTMSVYRKLGVSSRSDAVERMLELGILAPG